MYELATSQAFILALGALGLGMLMLIKGGDWTVDAAVYIARHFGVSPLVVGFTIIAFGTSLPELLVSTNANFKDLPGISIGNVVGSNIANILLVLGVTAAIATIPAKPRDLARDLAVMFGSTLYFIYLVNSGEVSRLSGFIMVGLLAIYVGWQYWMAKRGKVEIDDIDEPAFKSMPLGILFLLIGLVLTISFFLFCFGFSSPFTVLRSPDFRVTLPEAVLYPAFLTSMRCTPGFREAVNSVEP